MSNTVIFLQNCLFTIKIQVLAKDQQISNLAILRKKDWVFLLENILNEVGGQKIRQWRPTVFFIYSLKLVFSRHVQTSPTISVIFRFFSEALQLINLMIGRWVTTAFPLRSNCFRLIVINRYTRICWYSQTLLYYIDKKNFLFDINSPFWEPILFRISETRTFGKLTRRYLAFWLCATTAQ